MKTLEQELADIERQLAEISGITSPLLLGRLTENDVIIAKQNLRRMEMITRLRAEKQNHPT